MDSDKKQTDISTRGAKPPGTEEKRSAHERILAAGSGDFSPIKDSTLLSDSVSEESEQDKQTRQDSKISSEK